MVDKDIAEHGSTMQALMGLDEDIFSSRVLSTFLDSHTNTPQIELEINCNGGSTSETKVCYGMLETFKNGGGKVITKGYKVNSSAVVLFLAGSERLISNQADFIIHPVWIDPSGLPMKMESDDMIAFGNEMQAENKRLVDIYCSVIGEDKRVEVTQLMAEETNLSAQDAVRLGFATGILNQKKSTVDNNKSIAFSNVMAEIIMNRKNQTDMAKEESRMDKVLETMSNMAKAFVTKNETETETENEVETVNASAELSEGGSVYFDGELAEGTALFSDEAMESPIADGEFAMADGRSVMVAGGVVTELVAVADPEPEEENKEVAALNAKIKELENSNKAILENQEKQTDALSNLTDMLGTMKNLVVGDPVKKNVARRESPKDYKDMTNFEKLKYNRDNK